MNSLETKQFLLKHKVCAIVRGIDPKEIVSVVAALEKGGIKVIEVTFNTVGAVEMIQQLTKEFGDRLLVGAGTVLDSETAKRAIEAGAKFVLAPTLNIEMIKTCNRYGVLAIPGVLTPTEALTAWENGAGIIKVFPIGVFNSDYIKQIKAPLSQLEIMAVGGVGKHNIVEMAKSGATAFGIGGELVNQQLVATKQFDQITKNAVNLLSLLDS